MRLSAPGWSAITSGAMAALACTTAGCGGEGLARRFQVPEEKRVTLAAADSGDRTLRFPNDAPFNITDKTSTQSPGMNGSAESGADAKPDGKAACHVDAADGGAGSAEFHLGQCISNPGENARQAHVTVLCEYDIQAHYADGSDLPTIADYSLEVYINHADGLIVKRLPMESSAGGDVPASGSGRLIKELGLRLEPRKVYNVVLAGRVNAVTGEGGSAGLKIDVKRFELSIHTEPAPD